MAAWVLARGRKTGLPLAIAAVAVSLSFFLVALLWSAYALVQRSAAVLDRGQAEALMSAGVRSFTSKPGPPQTSDLQEFVESHRADGLRFMGLWRPELGFLVQAGEPATPLDDATVARLRIGEPYHIDDRVRIRLGPPDEENRPPGPPRPNENGEWRPPRREGEWRPGPPAGPPPDVDMSFANGERPRRGPHPMMILEFVPFETQRLQSYSRLSLGIGLTVLPVVVGSALFLVFLVRRQRELLERVEHGRRLAALGEMAAVIAHELRNPLTALKGHAQLLSRSLAGDSRSEKAERVVHEAGRLESFLRDLLEFSRRGEIDPQPIDPARLLRESAAAVQPDRIVVHGESAPPSWRLDGPRLQQALTNVLTNAVQISPADASVEAAVFAEHDRLVFEVRDAGPGIPPGEEERIFEPFYSRRPRGTGLGLSLARRIVTQHRGTITAENAPGGGALFRICLEKL